MTTTKASEWKRVVFAADCDEDGNCPVREIDYADCGCPGPTMDEMEYRERGGVFTLGPRRSSDTSL
jgi:hypothetical protein